MKSLRIFSLALACALPVAASAQWIWLDKDGRKVFSDQAPPAEVAPKNILKQPGMRGAPVVPPVAAAAAASGLAAAAPAAARAASAPKVTGKDKTLEDKKKEAEQEEEAKRKAEEEKLAKDKAQNCERAKRSLQAINSGERIRQPNAKGELEFISDQQRAAETKRLQGVATDCKS